MFGRLPESSCDMRNPFIVLRFVLFGILVYVNILTLGFAAWNLTVLKSLDLHVLGAPTFVVFNACFLVFLLVVALTSAWLTSWPFDQVRYECTWTGVVSTLQLASCFNITVSGPPALCMGISITACASSSLVVALSWISCMITLLYFFSLLTTAITHMSVIPDIWTTSVRAVPWFVAPAYSVEPSRVPVEKARYSDVLDIKRLSYHYPTPIFEQHAKALPPSPTLEPPRFPTTPMSPIWPTPKASAGTFPMERRTTWTSRLFGAGTLTHKVSHESMRPNWAKRGANRRGVDQPFAMPRPFRASPPIRPLRPFKLKSHWSQSTASPPPVPALPPKARVTNAPAHSLSPTSTFYIDLERNSVVPVGTATRPVSYEMFPEDVVDPDQPITRSQRNEWVRADSETSSVQ